VSLLRTSNLRRSLRSLEARADRPQ